MTVQKRDIDILYLKMSKFKSGDRCRVIKNWLSPQSIGNIVIIDSIAFETDTTTIYHIQDDEFMGYASEKCLELI